MSLDACPSNEELLRIKAEREARRNATGALFVAARTLAVAPTPEIVASPTRKLRRGSASPTEHQEQRKLFTWIDDEMRHKEPFFGYIFAVPNGAFRSPAIAGKSKAEGQRPGYFDIGWDLKRGRYTGFRGELKRQNGGTLSPLQQEWQFWYQRNGLYTCTVHGWEAMRDELLMYYNLKDA